MDKKYVNRRRIKDWFSVHSISLDDYIRARAYFKNETYTQLEVIRAIENLTLVRCVTELPTQNIRNNQLYLVVNNANLPSDKHNRYDLYLYVNGDWEQVDSLEFNIDNYYDKQYMDSLLNGKADKGHGHDNATSDSDGFMSMEDKTKLDGIRDWASWDMDSTPTANSDKAVKSGGVYTALSGKAPVKHDDANPNIYGVGSATKYGHTMAGSITPKMSNGNGNMGTDDGLYARADHVHPTDTSRASTSVAVANVSAGLMSASDKAKLDGIDLTALNEALDYYGGHTDIVVDSSVTANSNNPVTSNGIKTYVDGTVSNSVSGLLAEDDLLSELNDIVTSLRNL